MSEKTGWYTPNWNAFTIVDMDGNDIPVAAARLHTDNEQIYVHYNDKKGKKYLNSGGNDVAGVIIRKPFKVVPRPGKEEFEGRHIELSDPPKDYNENPRMALQFPEKTIKTGWESLDFTPAWWKRMKAFFADLRSK